MAVKVLYEGRVQGVGFRWTVKKIAKGFDVIGSVRNLPDGRVELIADGEEAREFLAAIDDSELRAHIRGRAETTVEAPLNTRGFEIRHD